MEVIFSWIFPIVLVGTYTLLIIFGMKKYYETRHKSIEILQEANTLSEVVTLKEDLQTMRAAKGMALTRLRRATHQEPELKGIFPNDDDQTKLDAVATCIELPRGVRDFLPKGSFQILVHDFLEEHSSEVIGWVDHKLRGKHVQPKRRGL